MINENETTGSLGPITITFGKFSPPHVGHHGAAQFGADYARKNNMDFRVYTSKKHMKKLKTPRPHAETPLSPEQKAKHLPRVLGVDKVHFEESPYSTIESLLAAGHSHVHIILGSDRIEDTAPGLREKYGDRVVPVQFGEKRSEGKKGIAGASSTKMREHARANNFEAFKGMLPGHVPEDHAREMFSDVRGGLKAAKLDLVENTNRKFSRKEPLFPSIEHAADHWGLVHIGNGKYRHFTGAGHVFGTDELKFMQHYGVMRDPEVQHQYEQILGEEVSAQTRIKLSRIAKRTAKIRAAKRRARVKRRRNVKQLKGRATQDVKNQLRHRYYKGSWQKLGFSTRARIDSNVNKRKKIADSMVRRIFPDVIRGENERLRKVNTRKESVEELLLPLLTEARIGQRKLRSGKIGANSAAERSGARKRKRKQRAKEDASKSTGKTTGSVKGHYAVVRATSGKNEGDLMIVDRHSYNSRVHDIVVAPDKFTMAAGEKLLDDENFTQTDSSVSLFGKIKGEKSAKLPANKQEAKFAEPAKKAKAKAKAEKEDKGPTPEQKKAQKQMMPEEPGEWDVVPGNIVAKRKQGRYDTEATSHDASTLELGLIASVNMALGMDPKTQVSEGLMSKDDMMKVIKNPHQSFLPAAQKIAQAVIKKFGPGISIQSTGKTIEGVDLTKEAQAAGIVSKTAKTDALIKERKTGKIVSRASVKIGDETQAASGNWQDTHRGLQVSIDVAKELGIKVPEKAQKKIKEMQEFLASDEYGGTSLTTAGPTELYTVGGNRGVFKGEDKRILSKEKSNQKLTDMYNDFEKSFPEIAAIYKYVQVTGIHKFDKDSPAVADTMLASTLDGTQVKIEPITVDLMKKTNSQLISRFKSGRVKGSKAEEKEVQRLIKIAESQGKKIQAEELRKIYAYRNVARLLMESKFEKANENYDTTPLTKLDGFQLLKMLVENAYEDSMTQIDTPELPPDQIKAALEDMKQIAEQNPLMWFEIMYPLFEYEMTPTTINWLDVLRTDGYTTNKVYINGREILIPVETPMNYPAPGMEIPTVNVEESYLTEKRNYRKEYDNYHGKPEQRKNRAGRVKARRLMIKMGRARKGDGKDIDHKDGNPRNNGKNNLRVRSKSANRADND